MKYVLVDWGDGFFVYEDGKYIGKDDQLDPWYLLEQNGLAEKRELTEEQLEEIGWGAPDTLEEVPV